jgi:hypothetical protein
VTAIGEVLSDAFRRDDGPAARLALFNRVRDALVSTA